MLSSASLFDSLPARPPTPPREVAKAVDEAITFLDDSNEIDRLTNKVVRDHCTLDPTPGLSPSSSQGSSISNTAKRVGFSPHLVYHKIARPGELSSPSAQLVKRTPLARAVRPPKSILKLANVAPPLTPDDLDSKLNYFSPETPGSFAKMLQSVIHQLAGPSRSSRLDAYLALNGVLRTYDAIPEPEAVAQKMGLITQFLSRDLAWKGTDGTWDTNMINQALKLTFCILYDSRLSSALDDDFREFLIERSIAVIEQPEMPKSIIKTHMTLLSQQRFNSSVTTASRADRIITALQTIEDRCSGNIVISARVVVYKRLLEQSPAIMLTRIRDWLDQVFHSMLSDVKDIRTRAIETCTRAGLIFGNQPHAGKALVEMFETEVEAGQTYNEYLNMRLVEMISNMEIGECVPQIWSAVVLFFRSKRKPLEKWPKFKSWILIIQRCLNSSDLTIRYQATLAWNKLVFTVMPDSTTTRTMMDMLKIPICSGMDKRGVDKHSQQVRHYALGSYYNLLHYALRPGLTNEEHDAAWNTFVGPVVSGMTKSSGKGRYVACRIIHGVVGGSTGVWNANVAFDSSALTPEDLPRLDARWVRSRLAKILNILEPVITASMWSSADANAVIDATWRSLLRSVADAGIQEVKVSNDLKEAIALLVSVFRRLWDGCAQLHAGAKDDRWLKRYFALIDSAVAALGAGPFVEDILTTTKDDSIEVAPTPSHRSSKHYIPSQSPFAILLEQFYHPPTALLNDEIFEASISKLIERFTSSKTAPTSRLDLLNRTLAQRSFSDAEASVKEPVWCAVARNAILALKSEAASSSEQESQSLGHGLRNALDILTAGLTTALHASSFSLIDELYDAMFDAAKAGAGEGGVVLGLMEPLAKALLHASEATMPYGTRAHLLMKELHKAVWPRNRQALDQARKSLWGVGLAPHKATIYDPFENLYVLIVSLISSAYNDFEDLPKSSLDTTESIISATIAFLNSSPATLRATALRKMQDGFVLWIQDEQRRTAANEKLSRIVSLRLQINMESPVADSLADTRLMVSSCAAYDGPSGQR